MKKDVVLKKKTIQVPLNRVEGDLEVRVEIEDRIVTDAWSSGIMYRGFEKILVGRGPLDGLVITPRICGICSTSHLTAASLALDMIAGAVPPPDAVRMRNLAGMTEHIHSDMRHGFLMFTADFANPVYQDCDLFEEAVRRYQPFKGETVIEVVKSTKKVLSIIAIIGGQWPHSSYMVPGGIASIPSSGDLLQCRLLLKQYRSWYERRILGCSLDRWQEVRSEADLDAWLEENEAHRKSDLGFTIRFARAVGLDRIGRGYGNFISYGAMDLPEGTQVRTMGKNTEHREINGKSLAQRAKRIAQNAWRRAHSLSYEVRKVEPADNLILHLPGTARYIPSGFAQGVRVKELDQEKIAEHVAYSWFEDYEGGKHPFQGETCPYATGQEGKKYSWAKAPRYDGHPAETGPLAEMVIAGKPLFTDLIERNGPNVFVRELARLVRPAELIPAMEVWLSETTGDGTFYISPGEIVEGEGFGLTDVTRGALGHWVRIRNGAIEHYQIITPTAWNLSPRDSDGIRGPAEEALVGTEIRDPSNPVELGHVVRSFDACLVCTVHTVKGPGVKRRAK